MVFHTVFLAVVFGAEAAVVVQRLAVDRHAFGPCFPYGLHTLLGADVDEVHRRSGPLGYPEHPPEGNVLGLVAVHQGHVPPLGALLLG